MANESVIKKAKDFVVKNKGKLAALAALGAVGAAGAYAHSKGYLAKPAETVADGLEKVGLKDAAKKANEYADEQKLKRGNEIVNAVKQKGKDIVNATKQNLDNINSLFNGSIG